MDQTTPNSPFGGPSPFYQEQPSQAPSLPEPSLAKVASEMAQLRREAAAARAEAENNREALRMIRAHIDGGGLLEPDDYDAISNLLTWVGQ